MTLVEKATDQIVASAFSQEKNVLRLQETRKGLDCFSDLNEKYRLHWETTIGNRQGIFHFKHPIKSNKHFEISVSKVSSSSDFESLNISVDISNPLFKGENFLFRLEVVSDSRHFALLSGKTVSRFKNKLSQSYEVLLPDNQEYSLILYFQYLEKKIIYVYKRLWRSI